MAVIRRALPISCRDLIEKICGLAIANNALRSRGSLLVKRSSYQKASSEVFKKWTSAAHINLKNIRRNSLTMNEGGPDYSLDIRTWKYPYQERASSVHNARLYLLTARVFSKYITESGHPRFGRISSMCSKGLPSVRGKKIRDIIPRAAFHHGSSAL